MEANHGGRVQASPFHGKECGGTDANEEEHTRVIIAEDDVDLRLLLAEVLRADGYEVVEAPDGEQLLDLVASQILYPQGASALADLIVSDVRMPGPSGLWALATLRHLDWGTPFLFITAFGDSRTHKEAARLGAAGVIDKPLDLDEFRSAVSHLAGPPTMRS